MPGSTLSPPARPLVVVSVGTDHHPFERLVRWADAWAADHPDVDVVVQYGTAGAPRHATGERLLPHARLRSLFERADVVVSHGGPSTVMDARSAGRLPIVVGRDPDRGEHVDGHQLRFADHLERHGTAIVARSELDLRDLIDKGLVDPTSTRLAFEDGLSPGVVAFGAHLDHLLGVGDRIDPLVDTDGAPGVSVVIATRDRPHLLDRALRGILEQEYGGPVEVIVVFDRSTPDHQLTRADGLRQVRVTANCRAPGLAGARNTGIATARYPWVAFCDDDDQWLPDKLRLQMSALLADGAGQMVVSGVHIHFRGDDTPRRPVPERVTHRGFLRDRMTEVHPSTFVVATDLLRDRLGGIDEALPGSYAEDYDLLLRATEVTAIEVVPRPLVRVYWHGSSFFFERWKLIDDALAYLVEKHEDLATVPAGLARIVGQQAVARAAMGQRSRALGAVRQVIGLNWREPRWVLAVLVAVGVPANRVLSFLHRFGRGI